MNITRRQLLLSGAALGASVSLVPNAAPEIISASDHPKALWPGIHRWWDRVYDEELAERHAFWEREYPARPTKEQIVLRSLRLLGNS